jgi:serine/threonine protein kinase
MEIYLDDLQKETIYELSDDLIYIEDIDQGAFGKVIHVKEKKTNQDLSVKIIDKRQGNQGLIKKMKEEISILKKLDHENIVKFYGHMETSNQFLIKMEYIKYGTLSQWMKKHKKISEEEASLILRQVLSAVAYLHNNQICHRDIKPENIMLSKENDLNSIKIIDFGLSAQNFDSLYNSDYCGTYIYMAPEEIERKSYYLSVDIWSIGILMYMLLNKGEHPFYKKGDSKEEFIKKLKTIQELKFNNKMSYMAMHLLKKLLEPLPLKRYKANDALKHPWITRNISDKIPQTFNDKLNNDNIINNAKQLMMISIFLNQLKKNNYYYMQRKKRLTENSRVEDIIDNINIKKNRKKFGIYKIKEEYIKKCEYISKVEKEKLKELREKCLDVSSTEEESDEKNSNIIISNNNSNTNSNFNSSNSNICSIKHCNTNKESNKSKNKIFSAISNSNRTKPIMLVAGNKKMNYKKANSNNYNNYDIIGFSEQKRFSFKVKTGKNLFLGNIVNDPTSSNTKINFNYSQKSTSKKKNCQNISRSITKVNIDNNSIVEPLIIKGIENSNNVNAFNYVNKNVNNIKPINLFLNNNIGQIKSTKFINRNFAPILVDKKNDKNKNIMKYSLSPLKLPIIDSKNVNNGNNTRKAKSKNKLLNLIRCL